MIRTLSLLTIICCLFVSSFAQNEPSKSVEQLIADLISDNSKLSHIAFEKLIKIGEVAGPNLLSIVEDVGKDQSIRVKAISVLGYAKYQPAIPSLIRFFEKEKDCYLKGVSAFALSQIGGDKVKSILLKFLEESFDNNDNECLPRALDAIKSNPDKRAFPTLMTILEVAKKQNELPKDRDTEDDLVQDGSLEFAIEALGQIGDSHASVAIAEFLTPNVIYHSSYDWSYLRVISKTKGKKVLPNLISYLQITTKKLTGKDPTGIEITSGNRQYTHDLWCYKQTIKILEDITGQKSVGSSREEVSVFWKQYWEIHEESLNLEN